MRQVAALYTVGASVRGMAPEDRLAERKAHSAPIVEALRPWFEKQLSMISSGSTPAAAITTLIMTAKLNDIDPLAWLSDVLARIAEIPHSRLPELLPWEWNKSDLAQAA